MCIITRNRAGLSADHVAEIKVGSAVTAALCSHVENDLRRRAKPRSVRQTLVLLSIFDTNMLHR